MMFTNQIIHGPDQHLLKFKTIYAYFRELHMHRAYKIKHIFSQNNNRMEHNIFLKIIIMLKLSVFFAFYCDGFGLKWLLAG